MKGANLLMQIILVKLSEEPHGFSQTHMGRGPGVWKTPRLVENTRPN